MTEGLVGKFLGTVRPSTYRIYKVELNAFAKHVGVADCYELGNYLIETPGDEVMLTFNAWRDRLTTKGYSRRVLTRKLGAVRSLVKLARALEVLDYRL